MICTTEYNEDIDRSLVLQTAPNNWDITTMLKDGISGSAQALEGSYNGCSDPNKIIGRLTDPFMVMDANKAFRATAAEIVNNSKSS